MATRLTIRRAGMTLVELLVVVAIIGLLAVTVLPSLATTTEGRRTRETVRSITSFIAQSQAKALGHPTGAGFGIMKTSGTATAPALDVVPAVIPDAYRGDTPSAVVTLAPAGANMTLTFTPTNSLPFTTGDLIRFDGRGAWYGLIGNAASCTLRSSDGTVDALAGQTAMNTPWPAASASHTFEIIRGPQAAGSGISLGDGRCIDVYWSSAGSFSLGTAIPSLPAMIYFIFDAAGSVRQVAHGASRFSPDGPILLLVGRVDRAGQPSAPLSDSDDSVGANWQYADSEWIAIDLLSGVSKSAPCKVGASDVAGSQDYIKSALVMGGR